MHHCLKNIRLCSKGRLKQLTKYMNVYQTSQMVLVLKNLLANAGDIRDTGSSLGWVEPLEEGMATHSSILAWRIPWTKEPSRLQSMGSQRVGYDWSDLARTHECLPERLYCYAAYSQMVNIKSFKVNWY